MDTITLRISYRPVRFGWCVRKGDHDSLRRALLLTHTLWGGRYNPIIPVDDEVFATYLVELFRIDALFPINPDDITKKLIDGFPHLPWPSTYESFEKFATFLDIYHPIREIYENQVEKAQNPDFKISYYNWEPNDPLKDIFLAMFGSLAVTNETKINYEELLRKLPIENVKLHSNQPIPAEAHNEYSINKLTSHGLYFNTLGDSGFYLGDASNFDDIVNFWNVRAANNNVLFFDPSKADRFTLQRDAFLQLLSARPERHPDWPNKTMVWHNQKKGNLDLSFAGEQVLNSGNGLNIQPTHVTFKDESVLATVSDSFDSITTTFQLPKKPFYEDRSFPNNERVAISIRPLNDYSIPKTHTLRTPYVPELNEFFGRNVYHEWNATRAEPQGLTVIANVVQNQLTLRAIPNRTLINEIFNICGFKSTPSKPGLIASRIIEQMGGLQACRVFKITGVRELIEEYSYLDSFTRSTAMQKIRRQDPQTGKLNFDNFSRLFIERRDKRELQPEDAFKFLAKKGVFRAGLKFKCPNCELELWVSIDDMKTNLVCEYCGRAFNATPYLKDRDWVYRMSGLFAKGDHQEGGIPVVVTIQQLDTMLSMRWFSYTTGTKLNSSCLPQGECELDFVLITDGYDRRTQIAFGECKTRLPITIQNVENLKIVADSLASVGIEPYIIFAKLSPFTNEEIDLCKKAQDQHSWRVILLSDRELEPYNVYDRAREEFEIDHTAISLDDLAKVTDQLYFNPQLKKKK